MCSRGIGLIAFAFLMACTTSPNEMRLQSRATDACGDGTVITSAAAATVAVEPFELDGTPTCADLGYGTFAFSFVPASGVFGIDASLGGASSIDVTMNAANGSLDWTATLSLDAVLVKAAASTNAYVYTPEALSGTGLSAPIDLATGQPYTIATVELCYDYELKVTKTAIPSFKRKYDWTITKSSPVTSATLSSGQVLTAPFSVAVAVAGFTDSDWKVTGEIFILNPAPFTATVTTVIDAFLGISIPVDCGVSFPYALAAGATLRCAYVIPLTGPTGDCAGNFADAHTEGLVGMGGTYAPVDFGAAQIQEVDECITTTDSRTGVLGDTCVAAAPRTFEYSLDIGPYECGDHVFANVARSSTNDTATEGSSPWSIAIDVPCEQGCTLTPGYWKTHSEYGPAPYDDAWALLPNGADTRFFLSGQTYLAVLQTPPRGNAYYILAHAYIAARLNGLNGADQGAVRLALAESFAIFSLYTPARFARLRGPLGSALRALAITLAARLDAYDNGLIGPGHCTE